MKLVENKVIRTIVIEVTDAELEYITRLSASAHAQNFVSSCDEEIELLRKSINNKLAEIWEKIQPPVGG